MHAMSLFAQGRNQDSSYMFGSHYGDCECKLPSCQLDTMGIPSRLPLCACFIYLGTMNPEIESLLVQSRDSASFQLRFSLSPLLCALDLETSGNDRDHESTALSVHSETTTLNRFPVGDRFVTYSSVVGVVIEGIESSKISLVSLVFDHFIDQKAKSLRNLVAVDSTEEIESHALKVGFPGCGEQIISIECSELRVGEHLLEFGVGLGVEIFFHKTALLGDLAGGNGLTANDVGLVETSFGSEMSDLNRLQSIKGAGASLLGRG